MQAEGPREFASIMSSLETLRQIALMSPDQGQHLTQELEKICNRYRQNSSGTATLIRSDSPERKETRVKYKNTRPWKEFERILGPGARLSEVRRIADTLSRNSLIPLSSDVRNHRDQLMFWFDMNWDVLSPLVSALSVSPGRGLS